MYLTQMSNYEAPAATEKRAKEQIARADQLKMVILDLAGTTIDYGSCAPAEALVELFKLHGLVISRDLVRQSMGVDKKAHIQWLLQKPEVSEQWQALKGKAADEEDIDTLYKEFVPLQMDILEKHGTLLPGVLEAQEFFRSQNIRIAVTTGYSREIMDRVLAIARRQGFRPDAAVCSDDVTTGRPTPWMALTAAARLGIYPTNTIIKIGDTEADILEGLNANMWTVGVAGTGNLMGLTYLEESNLSESHRQLLLEKARRQLEAAGAHYVIDTMEDILPVVDEINDRVWFRECPRTIPKLEMVG